jgi:RHS repeat-associated protein
VNGDVGSSCQDDPNADDPLCTTFEYDPFGNTSKITAADGTAQKMHYDAAGRRDSMVDPSLGTVVTHYDAFGEPSDQTNGAGQTSAYTYDALGRMTRIDSLDGATTLIWDTSPHGIGKLAGALSPDKVLTSYQYDELGHQTVTSSQLDKDVFEVVTGYDDIGRPDTVTYPEVSVPGGSTRLRVKNVYNANGYLSQVKDAATGGPVYWTAQQRNAAGQLTQEVQGNGVVSDYTYRPDTGLLDKINVEKLRQISYDYDANRNVTVRNDQTDGRYEAYGYDTLNRLDRWQARPSATGEPVLTSDYQYDRVGGLKTETTTQTGQPTQTTTYEYGYEHPELSAPAHALVKRNAAEYAYDNAGRQVTGPNRSIGYTAFDLPRTFDAMATTQDATPLHVDFRYDATGARLLKRDAGGSTFTAGDLFERRVPAGPSKAQVHNLNNVVANGRIVAQVDFVQATAGGAATTKVQYLHADQQGSTILVTGSKGTADGGDESIFNNLFYDPWGRRIDDNYQQIPKTLTDGPRQLYTGQYHDDEMSLINMKGRVYDPQARRFLTPDPILTEPLNTQSDDRYTYVRDNPTTMTDPTGHIGGADGGGGVDIFFCCGADAWNSAMDWIDGGGFDDLSPSPLDAPLITQTSTMASMLSVGNGAAGGADGLAAEDSVCRLEEETTCALPDDPAVSTAQDPVNRSDMSDSDSAGDQGDADDDEDDRGQNCDGCVIGAKGGKQNVRDTGLRDLSPEELQARYRAATGKEKQRLLKELKGRGLRHRAGADQRRPNRPQEQEQPAEEAQPEAQQPEQQPEQQPNEGQRPGTPDPVQERNGITAGEVGTAAGVAAGGLTVGGIIWWVLKVASPLCGPAAPACAVVL